MKIEIVTRNVKNEPMVRDYIRDKVHSAMDRFDAKISLVTIRLEDENPNSPAFAGHCQIDATLEPRGHVHVSAHGESVFDSVLTAMRKLESAIKHDIDRNRRSAKIRHQKAKQTFISSLTGEGEEIPLE